MNIGEFVQVHVTDGVGTLLLARPPRNALTRQMCREIVAAADELSRRDDVAAIILYGGHEVFSTGDDDRETRTLDAAEARVAGAVCRAAVDAVAAIGRPTVAAVTGYALGSGLTLALAADWRISGDNVKVGSTEILSGRAPAEGAAVRLAAAVGNSRAKDLVFSGRFVGADEALALGLVDELVAPDHVYDKARAWAGRFLDMPADALAAAKAAFVSL
ncbi:enoyl-CoA hydratase [Mycobacterium sp. OTB74]|uniref:enoyl-CoA hydratase n=1 Tax=Mycobacterium sp. OTB74 TaxID=1853452 RepID=UPI002473F715|nr:enoyl-CoA hydratase [Mycobacterium sp. OTB74]MDH6242900.1 enoyl-CoA hydratase [Mycobacterium sp. OTB74]